MFGAAVHHLSDIAVNLVYVDYADPGLCCQIAIILDPGVEGCPKWPNRRIRPLWEQIWASGSLTLWVSNLR